MKHGLLYVSGEITRIDPATRIVEGYCFVNEDVGKGKKKLSRAAMEEATEDYARWGCLREMHGSNAAGTANDGENDLGVRWDSTGAFYRTKVVDDAAWEKVEAKVYKGFSVGVRPIVMRGDTVTKCEWVEVSLVDRPADPDARLMIARADDYNGETEFEVEQETESRGTFADGIKDMEKYALKNAAWNRLDSILWGIQHGEEGDKDRLVREACREFGDYIAPIISRGEFGTDNTLLRLSSIGEVNPDVVTRMATAEAERGSLVTRAETAEAEVTRLEGLYEGRGEMIQRVASVLVPVEGEDEEAMVTRAVELLSKPLVEQPPQRITAEGLVRRLESSHEEIAEARSNAETELAEIQRTDWTTKPQEERDRAFLRLQELKQELAQ